MCGILGIYKRDGYRPDLKRFKEALELLTHRGPDFQAYWETDKTLLGHTLLSIVGDSEKSRQPMVTAANNYLVYNGEIYNHDEIKNQMEQKGVSFSTDSDSEVFLKGHERLGPRFLQELNGFFAAAIYSESGKKLTLFRDRFGMKPLYFHERDEYFIFSSEIKPILAYTGEAAPSPQALSHYFQYRHNCFRESMFKDVFKLQAGTYAEYTEDKGLKTTRYYDLERQRLFDQKEDDGSFKEAFVSAVRLRARAQKDTGVFLSSGLDSNSIASLAAKNQTHELQSFCVGFNSELDEIAEAKKNSEELGLNFHHLILTKDKLSDYDKAVFFLEEPVGDSIILPTLALCGFAGERAKIVLSGEGADEILNGYVHHSALIREEMILSALPKFFRPFMARAAKWTPLFLIETFFPYPSKLGKSGARKLRRHFQHLSDNVLKTDALINLFPEEDFGRFFKGLENLSAIRDYLRKRRNNPLPQSLTLMDLKFWNESYTLHRLDRLSMAFGLEARAPFMDHKVVEAALRLTLKNKTDGKTDKKVLRNSMRELIPHKEFLNRKKIPFFFPPERLWKKDYQLWAQTTVHEGDIERDPFLIPDSVNALLRKEDRELLESKRLFVILAYLRWKKLFLNRSDLLHTYRFYSGNPRPNIVNALFRV